MRHIHFCLKKFRIFIADYYLRQLKSLRSNVEIISNKLINGTLNTAGGKVNGREYYNERAIHSFCRCITEVQVSKFSYFLDTLDPVRKTSDILPDSYSTFTLYFVANCELIVYVTLCSPDRNGSSFWPFSDHLMA